MSLILLGSFAFIVLGVILYIVLKEEEKNNKN